MDKGIQIRAQLNTAVLPPVRGQSGTTGPFVLAYNLGNFLRKLALPKAVKDWSLRSVQLKLIKIGGRLVRHARRLVFQLAEVAVPRALFQTLLDRIGRLCPAPG